MEMLRNPYMIYPLLFFSLPPILLVLPLQGQEMATVAFRGLMPNHSVLAHDCTPKLSFQNGLEPSNTIAFKPASEGRPMLKDRYPRAKNLPLFRASSMGRNHVQLQFDDNYPQDPTFLHYLKESIRTMRSLFMFLSEQPGQLKYLEWPSLQSTLKTATLTLALVVVLIVLLSSVDSFLSLILALVLRKKA